MRSQAIERVRAGVIRPVIEDPGCVRALVVRRLSIKPVRQSPSGDPDKIIAAVRRGHEVSDSIH